MRINIKDLKVGQKVFVKPVGNAARHDMKVNILIHIREVEIEKVGNKFFYLKNYVREKFGYRYDNDDKIFDISDYSAKYQIYLTMQEVVDEKEMENILSELKIFFDWGGKWKSLNLEQLRRIKSIIDEVKS